MKTTLMRLPNYAKVSLTVAALVVLLNTVGYFADQYWSVPTGPSGSATATTSDGLAAWADLLRENNIDTFAKRKPIEELQLGDNDTLIIDEIQMTEKKANAVSKLLDDGATVIAMGESTAPFLNDFAIGVKQTDWTSSLAGVTNVRTEPVIGWQISNSPLLSNGNQMFATELARGKGRLVLLFDDSPISNRHLGDAVADNALFSLSILDNDTTVHFAEFEHGLSESSGFWALPLAARRFMFALMVCFVFISWSGGVRLGPADDTRPALPPRRFSIVEALASRLARRNLKNQPEFDLGAASGATRQDKPKTERELIDLVNQEIKKRGSHVRSK